MIKIVDERGKETLPSQIDSYYLGKIDRGEKMTDLDWYEFSQTEYGKAYTILKWVGKI